MVLGSKTAAVTNAELNKKIAAGHRRKEMYSENWPVVNINTIVDRFAPDVTPVVIRGKVNYTSSDGRYEVRADIGGDYLRIYDYSLNCHVDAYGNDVRNYIDAKGKQHGRSHSEQLALTHFRILKKKET